MSLRLKIYKTKKKKTSHNKLQIVDKPFRQQQRSEQWVLLAVKTAANVSLAPKPCLFKIYFMSYSDQK